MSKRWKKSKTHHDDVLLPEEFVQAAQAMSKSESTQGMISKINALMANPSSSGVKQLESDIRQMDEDDVVSLARTYIRGATYDGDPEGAADDVVLYLRRAMTDRLAHRRSKNCGDPGSMHVFSEDKAEWTDYAKWAGRVAGFVALATGNPVPLILSMAGDLLQELYDEHLSPEQAAKEVTDEVKSMSKRRKSVEDYVKAVEEELGEEVAAPAAAAPAAPAAAAPAPVAPTSTGSGDTTSPTRTNTETGGSSPGGASTGGVGSGIGGAGTGGAATGGASTGGAGTVNVTISGDSGKPTKDGKGPSIANMQGGDDEEETPVTINISHVGGGTGEGEVQSGDGPGSAGEGGRGEGSGGGGGGAAPSEPSGKSNMKKRRKVRNKTGSPWYVDRDNNGRYVITDEGGTPRAGTYATYSEAEHAATEQHRKRSSSSEQSDTQYGLTWQIPGGKSGRKWFSTEDERADFANKMEEKEGDDINWSFSDPQKSKAARLDVGVKVETPRGTGKITQYDRTNGNYKVDIDGDESWFGAEQLRVKKLKGMSCDDMEDACDKAGVMRGQTVRLNDGLKGEVVGIGYGGVTVRDARGKVRVGLDFDDFTSGSGGFDLGHLMSMKSIDKTLTPQQWDNLPPDRRKMLLSVIKEVDAWHADHYSQVKWNGLASYVQEALKDHYKSMKSTEDYAKMVEARLGIDGDVDEIKAKLKALNQGKTKVGDQVVDEDGKSARIVEIDQTKFGSGLTDVKLQYDDGRQLWTSSKFLRSKSLIVKEMVGGAQVWERSPGEWVIHDLRAGKDRGTYGSREEAVSAAATMGYKSVSKTEDGATYTVTYQRGNPPQKAEQTFKTKEEAEAFAQHIRDRGKPATVDVRYRSFSVGTRVKLLRPDAFNPFAKTIQKNQTVVLNLDGRGVVGKVTKVQGTDAWVEIKKKAIVSPDEVKVGDTLAIREGGQSEDKQVVAVSRKNGMNNIKFDDGTSISVNDWAQLQKKSASKSHFVKLGAILKGVEEPGVIADVNEETDEVMVDLDDGEQVAVPMDGDACIPEVEGELLGPFEDEDDAEVFAASLNDAE